MQTERPHSKTEAALAAAAEAHSDDPERAEALHRARRFKASWVELAEVLTDVRRSGRWRAWGYGSFDEYAKSELRLRQETVDKLTGSFMFLKNRAPEVLSRDGLKAAIPSYQAVDFLRRAESQEGAPEEALDEVRKRVLEEGASLPSLNRRFRESIFPPKIAGDAGEAAREAAAAVKNVATRLRELLDETSVVPAPLASEAKRLLDRVIASLEVTTMPAHN